MHFYPGYTAEATLAMPALRFFALLRAMSAITAEEDRRRLHTQSVAAFPGKDAQRFRQYDQMLTAQAGGRPVRQSGEAVVPGMPGVRATDEDLRGEIARKRAEHEQRRRERQQQSAPDHRVP